MRARRHLTAPERDEAVAAYQAGDSHMIRLLYAGAPTALARKALTAEKVLAQP